MIKLLLSDMDGTLLPFGEHVVSDRTRAAIRAAQEAGLHFGPASGRDRASLLPSFAGDRRCVQTGIMGNGKQVFLDGEAILLKTFEPAAIEALAQAVLPYRGCFVIVNATEDPTGFDLSGLCLGIAPDDEEALASAASARQRVDVVATVPSGRSVLSGGVFIDEKHADATEVRTAIAHAANEAGLDFLQPAPFFLDVVPHGWTKASALPTLLDAMGIGIDEVAFVGDSENDLTMMAAIPNSYAVGNATPEAKAAARHQLAPANEDPVARLLEELITR